MSCSNASSASDAAGGGRERKRTRECVPVCPLSSVFCPGSAILLSTRFARFATDSISKVALASLLTEFFLHKSLVMRERAVARDFASARASRPRGTACALEKLGVSKSYILSAFFKRREKVRGAFARRQCATLRTRCPRSLKRNIWYRPEAPKLCNVQKYWCFYRAVVIRMQCSRSPRALDDIATHSWLGGQHGEEAKDEDEVSGEKGRAARKSAGRRSKHSPLHSLRLRTTSMTASHGPARVEER